MSIDVRFLDPRHDAEPAYWEDWRTTAGLWANWSWPVLRAGAWTSRDPLLIAVLRRDETGAIAGVVAATVCGLRPRRHRFCPERGWPRPGYLHVQAPQSSAQPGWWFGTTDPAERAALFRAYLRTARRTFGTAALGVLWRQVDEADLAVLPRRVLTRPTEPVAVLDTPFADADAWLRGLRKSRRHDMRRISRSLAADPDLEVRVGPAADVVEPAEVVHLARLNHDKHGAGAADRRTGLRTVAWHRAALDRPDVTAVAYRDRAGRLLGAALILDHPSRPLWLTWGAESVEDGGRRHLYFDLYARVVARAVGEGKQAVVLGKGMAELKADLGARLVPQYAAVSLAG